MSQPGGFHISLRSSDNVTFEGTLLLGNWSFMPGSQEGFNNPNVPPDVPATVSTLANYDQRGATYFVIAVLSIYSLSIMMLILSYLGKRSKKIVEDKQIEKYLMDFQVVREKHDRDNYRKLKKTIVHKLHAQQKQRRKCHILEVIKESAISLLAVGMPSIPTTANNTPAVSAEAITPADEETLEANVQARATILGLKRTRTISGSSYSSSISGRGRNRKRTVSNSSCYSTLSSRSMGNFRRQHFQLTASRSVDMRNTLSDNCLRIPDITTAEVHSLGWRSPNTSASVSVEEEEEPIESPDDAAINRCRRPRLHNTKDGRIVEYPTRLFLDAKGKKLTSRSRSAATADDVMVDPEVHVVDMDAEEVWCDSVDTTPTDPFLPTSNSTDYLKPTPRPTDLLSPNGHTKRDAKALRQSFRQHRAAQRQPTVEVSCL